MSTERKVGSVTCPVLVVVGEHEAERDQAEALASRIAHARVVELSGAGRHGVVEQPVALAAVVTRFLAEVKA